MYCPWRGVALSDRGVIKSKGNLNIFTKNFESKRNLILFAIYICDAGE